MITKEFANQFAQAWVLAWNEHAIEKILSHYTDDFIIETPMAVAFAPDSLGKVSGKEAVRKYWTTGLERIPDLHFEIIDVLTGVGSITVYYFNSATGRKAAETMFFNQEGKVARAFVTYS